MGSYPIFSFTQSSQFALQRSKWDIVFEVDYQSLGLRSVNCR